MAKEVPFAICAQPPGRVHRHSGIRLQYYRLCREKGWKGAPNRATYKFENIALTFGIDTIPIIHYSSHLLFRFYNNYQEFAAVMKFLRNEVVNFHRFSLINTSQNTRKKRSPSARCEKIMINKMFFVLLSFVFFSPQVRSIEFIM